MKLHILTAVSRPRNIPKIAHSLLAWGDADYEWHLRFDTDKQHIGGQAVKNAILDSITGGWVWFLDDDTLAHPKLYSRVAEVVGGDEQATAVVFEQERADGAFYPAARENIAVSRIDIGQAVVRRDLIGKARIPEEYAGDGYFLDLVLDRERTVFLNETLAYHNRLEKR